MDVVCQAGKIEILVDRLCAARVNGVTIDLVEGPEGRGFKVENPNAPRMGELSVTELKTMLDDEEAFQLIDVRTPSEFDQARIAGATLLDEAVYQQILELPRDPRLVFLCHHGPRGENAARQFISEGFSDVHNVVGGIDAWSLEIDPEVPRY